MQSETKEVVPTKSKVLASNYLTDKEERVISKNLILSPVYVHKQHKSILYPARKSVDSAITTSSLITGFLVKLIMTGSRCFISLDRVNVVILFTIGIIFC